MAGGSPLEKLRHAVGMNDHARQTPFRALVERGEGRPMMVGDAVLGADQHALALQVDRQNVQVLRRYEREWISFRLRSTMPCDRQFIRRCRNAELRCETPGKAGQKPAVRPGMPG